MKTLKFRKHSPTTLFLFYFIGVILFATFIEDTAAEKLVNSSDTISIYVTVAELTAVTITPDSLTWTNINPGSIGDGKAIQIENIGSTNISKVWFNNSYPTTLPYGSANFNLHDAGNFLVVKRNQSGDELWFHPNLVEYNESELIYLTLAPGVKTHGRFRDGNAEYFWALKNDSKGGCTNGTIYIGVEPHNSTQQGTIDLSSCTLNLQQTGTTGCRTGEITRYNATWGYADVMIGRDGGIHTGLNYSIMVKEDCTQIIFYKWSIDLPTAQYTNNDEPFTTQTIYPGGSIIANVNVHVPYGVPTGQKTGQLTVFVQAVES